MYYLIWCQLRRVTRPRIAVPSCSGSVRKEKGLIVDTPEIVDCNKAFHLNHEALTSCLRIYISI